MDAAAAAGGGSGGGPAPFLLKTYDMVDDSSTDHIVSWSSGKSSFVVWDPPEFARLLLPTYFKHNNFSSFIRQLNTYGFRKIDPERWEFANEGFVKDKKHLLRNIFRRKPIHSHSHPQGSVVDPERAAFDEEIDKLSREKNALEADFLRSKQQQSAAKLQLEDVTQRLAAMEQRQDDLLNCLEKSVQNEAFIEHLARKIESMDFSAFNKKRRLPQLDHSQPIGDNGSVDENSCSRPDIGNIFHQDFSNKLNLELSPAVSDINLVSHSMQSSNEESGSPWGKVSQEEKDAQVKASGGVLFSPESLELSDTGTSFKFKIDSSLSRKAGADDSTNLQSSMKSFSAECDDHLSCHLNLTLASSLMQANQNHSSAKIPQLEKEVGKSTESNNANGLEAAGMDLPKKASSSGNGKNTSSSSQEAQDDNPKPPAAQVRVNDVFWEQFLTERPGSSDTEETNLKAGVNFDDQEDRRSGHGMSRNTKNMEQLTL